MRKYYIGKQEDTPTSEQSSKENAKKPTQNPN